MGDVITRFKLETTQFDSKLRDSSKNLQEISRQGQLAGSEFDKFTKNSVEAARSLGQVASGATTTKDKLKDLVGAYNDLARAYNTLTQEQQQSDFAKAMSQSLDELKTRITDAKNELYGLGDAAEQTGNKFGGALQVFVGNMLTKGAEMMSDIVKQSIDLAKSSEGVEMAFERLNRPELLDQLKEATHGTVSEFELMKAAVKFDDFKLPVEELGTMLAFAQKKAKDTGQSVDYMVDSIVTGLGRKSLMILDNLGLSAAEVKEKMAETGDMTTAVGAIIREQMKKAGDYVETAADRAARAAADQQNAMRNLGKSLMPIAEGAAFVFSTITTGVTKAIGFIVENKNAILALSSAVAAYTVVVNFNTIAVKAQKAATEAAAFAQKALNLAMKANPYGLAAAAIAAATTALIAYSASSEKVSQQEKDRREVAIRQMQREQAERQRLADRAKNEENVISSATSDIVAKYQTLQAEWVKLKTEQEKNNFLKENSSAFDALGASIRTAADAQKFFVEQSKNVIEALSAMAEAEAMKELLKEEYKKRASNDLSKVDPIQYKVSTAEMRQLSPSERAIPVHNGKHVKYTSSQQDSYIQNFINKNTELKAAGLTPSDYRYYAGNNGRYATTEYHMNASGLSKLEDYRKNNYIKNQQEESDSYIKELNDRLGEAAQRVAKASSGISAFKGSGTTTTTTKSTKTELTEIQKNQTEIDKLTKEYQKLSDVQKTATGDDLTKATERKTAIQGEIRSLQTRNEELKKWAEEATGNGKEVTEVYKQAAAATKKLSDAQSETAKAISSNDLKGFYAGNKKIVAAGGQADPTMAFTYTSGNLDAFISNLKEQISQSDLGTDLYNNLTSQLSDATMLGNLMQEAVKNGIDIAQFEPQKLWDKIFKSNPGDYIEDEVWDNLAKAINDELKKRGIKIAIDANTGGVSETKNSQKNNQFLRTNKNGKQELVANSWLTGTASGISSLKSGLEDLGVKLSSGWEKTITKMNAIASILTGISTIAAAIESIVLMQSFKLWNTGGIVHAASGYFVPGNYGYDAVPSLLTSGELVLNRAQQGNLAAQLQGAGGGYQGVPYTNGETIVLGVNNHFKRSGQGEIVTTGMLKRMGVM